MKKKIIFIYLCIYFKPEASESQLTFLGLCQVKILIHSKMLVLTYFSMLFKYFYTCANMSPQSCGNISG